MGRGRGERREKGRERREEGSGMLGSCGEGGSGREGRLFGECCLGLVFFWEGGCFGFISPGLKNGSLRTHTERDEDNHTCVCCRCG